MTSPGNDDDDSAATEARLRAAIRKDPSDASYLVYGDWLQARGDPQGELVALMHGATTDAELAKKVERAVRKHRGRLGIDRGISLTWRLGFVDTIRVITRDRKAWIHFLKTDAARFAQTLELSSASGHLLDVGDTTQQSGALPTSLRYVVLKGTRVAGLEPLANLVELRQLILEQTTKVHDLSPLSALALLEHLDASGTRAADLKPLASLGRLRKLHLPAHSVKDLSPLCGLPQVEELLGRLKLVTDLSPLMTLPKLRRLELCNLERVRDLRVLSALAGLEELSLIYREAPTDLTPLTNLTCLRKLNLNGSNVTDLDPLRGLKNLTTLSLEYTTVTDLKPLAGCVALEDLSLRFVESVTDLSALRGLKNLKTLDVCYTGARREERRALMAALPSLDIRPNLTAE